MTPEDDQNNERSQPWRRRHDDVFQRPVPNVITVMGRLGYDAMSNEDLQRLSDTLHFAEELRKREERIRSSKTTAYFSAAVVVLGAIISAAISWAISRLTGRS